MQSPPPVSELLQLLESMATRVSELLNSEAIDWLWCPGPEEWSLTEVICHLRDVEREVHQVRFRTLISTENAFLPGVSADEWAGPRGYCDQDGRKALVDYLSARYETLSMLNGLEDNMWERQGRHAFLGPTSMHELLFIVIRHDEIHWKQILALINNQNNND